MRSRNKKTILPLLFVLALSGTLLVVVSGTKKNTEIRSKAATSPIQTIEGTLEGLVEDDFEHNTSKETYYVNTIVGGQNKKLEVDFQTVVKPKLGSTVKVNGATDQTGVLNISQFSERSTPALKTVAPTKILINGQKKVAIIHVNFNDVSTTTPMLDYSKNLLDREVNNYFIEVSFGKLSYTNTDVFGWYTMPIAATCDKGTIANNAIQIADPDINFSDYSQVMVITPNLSCSFSSFSYYPPGGSFVVDGGVTKHILLSVYRNIYINQHGIISIPHEFGHNFGARHASGLECGSAYIGPNCIVVEYGNDLDIMGGNYQFVTTYGAYEKELFGWMDPNNSQTVTTSGRYIVNPIEIITSGVQQLKIPMSEPRESYLGNIATNYIIENRVQYGLDSNMPITAFSGGIIKIAPVSIDASGRTLLIDSTPHSNLKNDGSIDPGASAMDARDAPFTDGTSFVDPYRGIIITPVSKNGGILTVDIEFVPPNSNPTSTSTPVPTATPTPTSTMTPTSTPSRTPTKTPTSSPTSTTPPSKPGDANGDNKIDGIDYVIWLNHYNQNISGPTNGDFNSSGKVDGVDYVLWANNYGK